MAVRKVKLIGRAFTDLPDGMSLVVTYNGKEVFNGIIPAFNEQARANLTNAELDTICSWETTSTLKGKVPLTITPYGGSLVFQTLEFNLMGDVVTLVRRSPDVKVDPKDPTTFSTKVVMASVDNFGKAHSNSLETDGKDDVTIDGVAQLRLANETTIGDWQWIINADETFSCMFNVER